MPCHHDGFVHWHKDFAAACKICVNVAELKKCSNMQWYSKCQCSTWIATAAFFPILNYVIPEVLPPSLMGSALASGRSVLELADIGSVGYRDSFRQLLREAIPAVPPTPSNLQHKFAASSGTARPSARSCTWVRTIPAINTGWGMKGLRAALLRRTGLTGG